MVQCLKLIVIWIYVGSYILTLQDTNKYKIKIYLFKKCNYLRFINVFSHLKKNETLLDFIILEHL